MFISLAEIHPSRHSFRHIRHRSLRPGVCNGTDYHSRKKEVFGGTGILLFPFSGADDSMLDADQHQGFGSHGIQYGSHGNRIV